MPVRSHHFSLQLQARTPQINCALTDSPSLFTGLEKQKMLLASDSRHFSIVRALHLADLITEMNGFCGFMSILSTLRYCLGPADDHRWMYVALALVPLGLAFDFMDGKVARWRGKSSLMGQELDSLADLVCKSMSMGAGGEVQGKD